MRENAVLSLSPPSSPPRHQIIFSSYSLSFALLNGKEGRLTRQLNERMARESFSCWDHCYSSMIIRIIILRRKLNSKKQYDTYTLPLSIHPFHESHSLPLKFPNQHDQFNEIITCNTNIIFV